MASRELSILVTAKNMASRVLGEVRGDIGGLEGAARRAGSNVGRNLAIGGAVVAGGIAVGVRSGIDSLVELERVNNLTAAALESTGDVAGQSVEGIRARAEAMERLTGVDDKAIQNAENLLLTFRNVGEDAFEPTLEAALNLNAALGGDDESLQGVLMQVAKAMNDPIRGLSRLERSGVSFTDAQKDQIRTLQESGDMMGAQTIILGELETQFGDAAEKANEGPLGAQRAWTDAIEDIQKALATGFLPLIQRSSDMIQGLVADPEFMAGVENFGNVIASGFDEALDFVESVDWGAVGDAFGLMGSGAKAAMDMFLGAPPWLQTAIVTGWGLNKLTGGALGSIVGALGSGLIKGVLGMNAGVVNINAGVVNGGGGVPGVGGRGPGGFLGGLAGGLAMGAGVAAAGVAAVEVVNFENMRNEQRTGLQGILDEMPRTRGRIDESIAAIEREINMERPLLDGILFNTNVKPQLEAELAELREIEASQKRSEGATAARESHAAARDAGHKAATQNVASRVDAMNAAQVTKLATIEGVGRESLGAMRTVAAKNFSPTVTANVSVTSNLVVNDWQRTVTSAIRAQTPTSPRAI